jgi:hypothetical protein
MGQGNSRPHAGSSGRLENLNNEGFAIAPATQCSGGNKPVFWADDSETDGHAIRNGTLTCSAF